MALPHKILDQMRREPANVRFSDLKKICEMVFGPPRQHGTSHAIFKTPWPGDPRVNIQNAKLRNTNIQTQKKCISQPLHFLSKFSIFIIKSVQKNETSINYSSTDQ